MFDFKAVKPISARACRRVRAPPRAVKIQTRADETLTRFGDNKVPSLRPEFALWSLSLLQSKTIGLNVNKQALDASLVF